MPEVIGIILGVFAVLSAVASVAAFFKANLSQKIIETLKESNAALTERVTLLEGENTRDKAQIRSLLAENAALQTYVSGTEAVKELAQIVGSADKARADEHHDIIAAIQALPVVVTAHHEEVMAAITAAIHTHPGAAA